MGSEVMTIKPSEKILVLGASGMLGHKVMQVMAPHLQVTGTVRRRAEAFNRHPVLGGMTLIGQVNAFDFRSIESAIDKARPSVLINCIGMVKQLPEAKDPLQAITINALLPHQLACHCRAAAIRLIHISTDCVFSGRKGNYAETDSPDADDLYGRSKFLGELDALHGLTLRTSLIGRELQNGLGLIEWFLRQRGGRVPGYTRAIFSGVTTQVMGEALLMIICEQPTLRGLWHLASEPIAKYQLLALIRKIGRVEVELVPNDSVVCDRSLNGHKLQQKTGYCPPSWPVMIEKLFNDPTPYDALRRKDADR
jgi:dTDP-4-dehydrorhamnose reductase